MSGDISMMGELYVDACPHHFAIEGRIFVVFHQYWLDEGADFANVARNVCPLLPRVCDFALGDDDGHVEWLWV